MFDHSFATTCPPLADDNMFCRATFVIRVPVHMVIPQRGIIGREAVVEHITQAKFITKTSRCVWSFRSAR